MAYRGASALAAGLLLAGCAMPYSPAPVATNFASTHQPKLQAAAHWGVIARHMATELGPTLKTAPSRSLYVEPLQLSIFSTGVKSHLVTALVNDGFVVVKNPVPGALKIELDTQVVAFSADRPQYRYAGLPTALASGAWVLTSIQHSPEWLLTAGVYGFDAHRWFTAQFAPGDTPRTEMIVTVSVADEQRYYTRNTSVYYTSDEDLALYDAAQAAPVPTSKTFAVKDH
ncbi:hypothetical protein [Massilia sp. CFBP9026]|uniref:hypothetical protein n=1 Tax=Massilia sp. CFBP9026 TaxID=3096536 RepID=UPI002A6B89D8|nr:hypothetical protein [Massilia sp. CFBP9026]MDY0963529.1 hypothetical protein [Massilia sp. CFBP9026]